VEPIEDEDVAAGRATCATLRNLKVEMRLDDVGRLVYKVPISAVYQKAQIKSLIDQDVRVLIALHRCEAWLRAERLRRARDELEGV